MAYIREFRGKWRVEVQKHGQRVSKVTETKEDAELWADHIESKLDAQTIRYTPRLVRNGPDLVTMVPRLVMEACRDVPYDHNAILEAAIPTAKPSGVYFLIRNGEVVYTGQSVDVLHRIARHRREGKVFDAFSYIECEREEMDRLESLYIRALVPLENLSFGNHRAVQSRPHGG